MVSGPKLCLKPNNRSLTKEDPSGKNVKGGEIEINPSPNKYIQLLPTCLWMVGCIWAYGFSEWCFREVRKIQLHILVCTEIVKLCQGTKSIISEELGVQTIPLPKLLF